MTTATTSGGFTSASDMTTSQPSASFYGSAKQTIVGSESWNSSTRSTDLSAAAAPAANQAAQTAGRKVGSIIASATTSPIRGFNSHHPNQYHHANQLQQQQRNLFHQQQQQHKALRVSSSSISGSSSSAASPTIAAAAATITNLAKLYPLAIQKSSLEAFLFGPNYSLCNLVLTLIASILLSVRQKLYII